MLYHSVSYPVSVAYDTQDDTYWYYTIHSWWYRRHDTLWYVAFPCIAFSHRIMGPPRPPRITAGYHTFCDTAGDTVHDTGFVISPGYLQIYADMSIVDRMIPFYDTTQIRSDQGQHVCDMYFQIWVMIPMIYTWYTHDTHMIRTWHINVFLSKFCG